MEVGLFVPCYIDQFYPTVARATLKLLRRLGCTVHVPLNQACCGQPAANAGMAIASTAAERTFYKAFADMEIIVAPSASCVCHVRDHYSKANDMAARTMELCEFLVDVLRVNHLDAHYPYRVGLHEGCHGLRGLRLGASTELHVPAFNKVRQLLSMVGDLQLVTLERADECCGFGGTFAVSEAALSVKMGRDRLRDHQNSGAQVITSTDMSCLMHLWGLANRHGLPLEVRHVAEILNSTKP